MSKIIFTPSYTKHFKCIAGECKDSCCIGWNIHIDKKSYKNYKKIRGTFGEKLNKFIKRNRKAINDEGYAKIVLDEEKRCPFLDKNNLCEVYINCGEDNLSKTCTFYPRVYNMVDNVIEKSLYLSCPLVAKLVLLNKNPMEFDEIELNEQIGNINEYVNTNSLTNSLEKYFWNIRIFSIDLLQNRNYSIDQRLIILGLFYQKIDKNLKDRVTFDIESIIDNYNKNIDDGVYKEFIDQISANNDKKVMLLKQILECNQDERLKKYYNISLEGFKLKNFNSDEQIIYNYNECYKKYYNLFIKENSYILENYLVNYVFQNAMPFSKEENVFDKYVIMIIFYSIIKVQLIGLVSYYKGDFSLDLVIDFIQVFTKIVNHNPTYINYIYSELKRNNLNNMACMTMLIKD